MHLDISQYYSCTGKISSNVESGEYAKILWQEDQMKTGEDALGPDSTPGGSGDMIPYMIVLTLLCNTRTMQLVITFLL